MKRSTQVALVVMGVAGVGASAYAFTSNKRDCVAPSVARPATPAAANSAVDTGATPALKVDPKLATNPCPPRRTYANSTYRSHWYSYNTGPSYWSTPIFGRRTNTTTAPSTSPNSLGFTSRPSTSTTTSRVSTTTAPTRTGFGTIGRSFSVSS
jgi:hypothetical protein